MSLGIIQALLAAAGLAAMAAAWWAFARRASAPDADGDRVERAVRVHGRYLPEELHVPAGRPARIVFFREETAPCSERVVFPDLGLNVGLPAFREVGVDLPAQAPGVHAFTCEMEMLRGRVVVDPPARNAGVAR